MSTERTVENTREQPADNAAQPPIISPLTMDKTYGERMYNFVFSNLFNFWTNLFVSAAFSLWTAHSVRPIKLPFMKEAAPPHQLQQKLAGRIEDSWIIRSMKNASPEARTKRAFAMAELLTLLTPGHIIMIPSVWLGAKIKPAFVKYFDRKHYGKDAMDDPSIEARHAAIEAERRPTFLGAVVGRLGTVGATQLTARFIGSEENFVNTVGKKINNPHLEHFEGVNPLANRIGSTVGHGLVENVPLINRLNSKWSARLDWSVNQRKSTVLDTNGAYNRAVLDFTKFTAMDTLYTFVTAATIHPILNLLHKVPGMTYKPKVSAHSQEILDTLEGRTPSVRYRRPPRAERTEEIAVAPLPPQQDIPRPHVSDTAHLERVHDAPEKELHPDR